MQRLEEIAKVVYQSSAAGKNKIAKPKEEAVPEGDTPAASDAAAEEGSCFLNLADKAIMLVHVACRK